MDWIATLQGLLKPAVVLAYAVLGALLLAAAGRRLPSIAVPAWPLKAAAAVAAVVIWGWFGLHGAMYIVSALLGIVVFALKDATWRAGNVVMAGAAVVVTSLSLAWWLGDGLQPAGWWRPAVFAIVVGLVQAGFLRGRGSPRRNWIPLLFALFAAAGFVLLANVAQYQPGSLALSLLVHHRGAYIGPALHIKAGLVPFFDIPLQYGLGPTLSVAAVCGGSGCWSGMEYLMVASSLAMGILILWMALSTRVARGTAWRVTAACVVFAAMYLWPGFASVGSIVSAFPSIGGLRFLPVTLLAFLLFFQKNGLAAVVLAPAVLWSPEAGMMAIVVYGVHETARLGFVKAAVRCAAIVAAAFIGLVAVHRMVYGVWLQPDVFAEYVLHVPTPYPINPIGPFCFLVAALGLAAWNVFREPPDPLSFRRDLVASCLLFGTVSYYLGRSHPNNICNLMPFIVLVALRTLDGKGPERLTILGVATSAAALALSGWFYTPFGDGFSLDTNRLAAGAARQDTDMAQIRSRISNPDHLGIADLGHLNRNPAETLVWTAMDPCSLWTSVPHDRRQLYIKRSAARLRLAGWVILADDQRDWLNDFRVAYRVTGEASYKIQSGTYVVAHLVPLDEVVAR